MNRKNEKSKRYLYILIFCMLLFSISCYNNSRFIKVELTKNKLRSSAEFDPSGLIAMWSGPLNTIPAGWKLCDGNGDTLNISNRFVYNTDDMEEPGTTGGNSSHDHSYTTVPYHDHGVTDVAYCGHTHNYNRPTLATMVRTGGTSCISPYSTTGTSYNSAYHSHNVEPTGEINCYTSEEENIIPPYYELAFIKKETSEPGIPIGLIMMWAGTIENIPAGWELCNGSNGTPDLSENFIRGTSSGEDPGSLGGSLSHNHTYTDIPRHSHSLSSGGASHDHGYQVVYYGIAYYSGPDSYAYVYTRTYGYTETASVPHTHTMDEVGIETCETQNADHLPPYYKIAFIMNTEVADALPMGSISLWGDSISDIPSGWYQCNGSNGTPDMVNRFPRGIAAGEQPGITGGSVTHRHFYNEVPLHTHTILQDPMTHNHQINYPNGNMRAQSGSGPPIFYAGSTTDTTYSTGPAHNHDISPQGSSTCYTSYENNLPPFVKLIYMQKCVSIFNPSPADGAIGVSYNPILNVETSDLEGDDLIIRFYNASDDSVIDIDIVPGGSGTASVTWMGLSSATSYSWYVIADDGSDTLQFDTWSFTTNHVPNEPTTPFPNNVATNISYNPILSVEVFDVDENDLTVTFYDALDDSVIDTDMVLGGSGTASVIWSGLSPGTVYSWYVIVDDGISTNQSSTWLFTTNYAPNEPINPSPNDEAIDVGYNPTLLVDVYDADGDDLTVTFYDASDDSVIDTDAVLGGSGTASVVWPGLSPGTTYSWYGIVDDGLNTNQSSKWSFTTVHIPNEPTNPFPSDGATDIDYNPTLSVDVYDDDGDDLIISFYNASDDSIIDTDMVFGGSGAASVVWSGLSPGNTYSWYAIADDGLNITQSYTWSFTTNHVPNKSINPNPNDGVPGIGYSPALSVDVFDVDGDDLTATFYNALDDSIIDADIVLGGSGTASVTWLGLSSGRSYSWYVIVDDGLSTNQSATWTFITNHVPDEPTNPSPSDAATDISYNPTLSIELLDVDGDNLTAIFYDASDDSVIDTDIVLGGSGTASVTWSGISSGTSYSWYVTVDDGLSTNQSATWSFTTVHIPYEPTNPSPSDAATDISYNPTLSVDVYDDDGDDLTITFYDASDDSIIDTDNVSGGSGAASVVWSGLSPGTTYLWYVIVDDGLSTNQSAKWSFITNQVPNEPTNPYPSDGAIDIIITILSVDVSDDDGDDLTITFYNASDDSLIDTNIVTDGSGTALVTWSGLSNDTSYTWYVIVDDGLSTTQSSIWEFSTSKEVINPPKVPGFNFMLPVLISTVTIISAKVYLKRKKID